MNSLISTSHHNDSKISSKQTSAPRHYPQVRRTPSSSSSLSGHTVSYGKRKEREKEGDRSSTSSKSPRLFKDCFQINKEIINTKRDFKFTNGRSWNKLCSDNLHYFNHVNTCTALLTGHFISTL